MSRTDASRETAARPLRPLAWASALDGPGVTRPHAGDPGEARCTGASTTAFTPGEAVRPHGWPSLSFAAQRATTAARILAETSPHGHWRAQ